MSLRNLFLRVRCASFIALLCPHITFAVSPTIAFDDRVVPWDTATYSVSQAIADIDADATLKAHRGLIIDRCGLHSVNPRLVRALLLLNRTLQDVDANDVERARFRIDALIVSTSQMFFMGRKQSAELSSLKSSAASSANAGVDAIARTFVDSRSVSPNESAIEKLAQTYQSLFGSPPALTANALVEPAATPRDYFRLPWLLGQTGWSFNGVHSASGGCPSQACGVPRSAIDFSRGWPAWGANTDDARVLAAAAGTVSVFSSCNMRIAHPNGWSTGYYHMANLRLVDGQTVYAGQYIGNYADNQAQALCEGGSSTGPHVHITLQQNGVPSPMDQAEMSGWLVNAASVTRDYDSDCSRMNLSRSDGRACSYNGTSPAAWAMHLMPARIASNKTCDFDIDGDGATAASTDSLLLLRCMLGIRGAELVANALGATATRNTPQAVADYIATRDYDVDIDGSALAATDGLLISRIMGGDTRDQIATGTARAGKLLVRGSQVSAFTQGCR
jgi:LasA protease